MQILRFIPLFGVLFIAYNAIMLFSDVFTVNAGLLTIPMMARETPLVLTASEVFSMLGVVLLYFEILKSTRTSQATIVEHGLSTVVLLACVVEFIVVPGAGTAAFMMLTLLALLDLVAGFTITIVASRRDFAVGDGGN
jgi:hypothetical protein